MFITGGIFAAMDWQPMRSVLQGFYATKTLVEEATQERPKLLWPRVHTDNGVLVHDRDLSAGGLTLVQGILEGGPQLRLVDMNGTEIHRWEIDFFKAWDNPTHIMPPINVPKSWMHTHTQGFVAHPDGSVLVNIGGHGSVKISRCGDYQWTVDRMTHHSVTLAKDGGYWIPSHHPLDQVPDHLLPPGMSRARMVESLVGHVDNPYSTVLWVDASGKPGTEFMVLQAFVDAGLESMLFDGWRKRVMDPLHLNDIDEVTPALAARIDGVEPGDLLLSLRTLNTLAILDRDTGALNWHFRGPWVLQHDPDITPEGYIDIFNNRLELMALGEKGSQIVRFDPSTEETTILHPKGEEDRFYTFIMGSHQVLPNGNRLIVESISGRIIEVTPDGKLVWSYVMAYDEDFAALIEHAERVPADFFDVKDWTCG